MENLQDALLFIEKVISENKIVLFMKGIPDLPRCGFSDQAVRILRHYTDDFTHIDVLQQEYIREGIKQYTNWPTIPQLYVDKTFVGGADIITQMHQKKELNIA